MIGKKVGRSLYFHKKHLLDVDVDIMVDVCEAWEIANDYYDSDLLQDVNIIKHHEGSVTFLCYKGFDKLEFPELTRSFKVDKFRGVCGSTGGKKYSTDNPPILHRKELLVRNPPKKWSVLTKELEKAGAFNNTKIIGYKQRWLEVLENLGIKLKGYKATY